MFDSIRILNLRRRADQLARERRLPEAYAAYREVAEYRAAHHDRVLAAWSWKQVAFLAAEMEDRTGQVEACQHALALLPPWPQEWETPLSRETGVSALWLAADGLQWLNRLGEAEAMARIAVAAAERYKDTKAELFSYGALAQALLRLGRPAETLGCQRRILELVQATGEPLLIGPALADFGTALAQVQQLDEAADAANEALRVLDSAGTSDQANRARIGPLSALAVILRRTGDHAGAIAAAEQAMDLSKRYLSREQYLQARMAWALALLADGDLAGGQAALAGVYDELLPRGSRHLAGRAATNIASALLQTNELEQAREWAERGLSLKTADDIEGRGWGHFVLAQVSMARGDLAAAENQLLEAAADLEAVRRDVTDDWQHVAVLDAQARIYRALQACRIACGDPGGALVAAERARGRSLLRGLARTKASAADPLADEFTIDRMTALAAEHQTGLLIYSLIPRLDDQITTADVPSMSYADDVAGLHAWYVDANGVSHATLDMDALHSLRESFQPSPEPDPFRGVARDAIVPVAFGRDLPDEQFVDLLSRLLIAPMDAALAGTSARELVVVPDGELDILPYAALGRQSGGSVADRWATAIAPAVAVFAELVQRPAPTAWPASLLLVGNPAPVNRPLSPGLPTPNLPPLRHAEREVRAIAADYGADEPLLGAAATKAAALARLTSCEIAHFATHGVYGSDEGSTPGALCLSPDGDDDGYLRADEIRGLHLPSCRIAVLSACRTGWGRSSYEGTLGLARAFLLTGVPAVVVSLWPVDDASTADLMINMHRELRGGLALGEALRRTTVAARDAGAPLGHWASFTIVGNPNIRITQPQD